MTSSLQSKAEEVGVRFIRFQFTDIFGSLRGLEIPVRLVDSFIENGIGVDGSSIGFASSENSDLLLKPDPLTFQIIPWNRKIAAITCNVLSANGSPLDYDPRTILQNQIEKIKSRRWMAEVRPELEYYLVKDNKPAESSSYFFLEPFEKYAHLRREVIEHCLELDMNIKYAHSEVGPGQQEIEMGFNSPVMTADHLQLMKQIVRLTATNAGLTATFLPKPFGIEAGSGLHIHQRLLRMDKTGIFGDEKTITNEGRYYIGGLLAHARAMTAFFNPINNSYKRMVPGQEAPVYLSWGIANRSTLIRNPGYEKSIRIEYRGADAASNIYLLLTLLLAAGIDGIDNKIEPPNPCTDDVTALSLDERKKRDIKQLPISLHAAIELIYEDPFLETILGKQLIQIFRNKKLQEWNEYNDRNNSIAEWDFQQFLHCG